MTTPALEITNLDIAYAGDDRLIPAVRNVSLSIAPGEFVGLAGESGCGKSTIAQSILRLLKAPGIITGGTIKIDGRDILTLSDDEVRATRWNLAAIVLQNALTALTPVHTVGWQLQEVLDRADRMGVEKVKPTPADLLTMVGIDPSRIMSFPHELSGGMRQRVVIAMALALRPKLLILDEPTTALDVIVQQEIFETIKRLKGELGFAVLLITHDLPLLLDLSDRIAIMKDGQLVELADARLFRTEQQHPYSRQLIASTPRLDRLVPRHGNSLPTAEAAPILFARGLRKTYRNFHAVGGIDFDMRSNEIVAVVGESGSGKSTFGRMINGLIQPSGGELLVAGAKPIPLSIRGWKDPRPAQMVFQDVYGSLNPLHTIEHHLRRSVIRSGKFPRHETDKRVHALLELVGLLPVADYLKRRPHELSGGQRQRVGLARALASEPQLLVADEPISMLDVSIRLDILNLIARLRDEKGVAILYITHDIVSAGYIADRIVVMNSGRIVEQGPTRALIANPSQDYTRRLLAAIPGGADLLRPADEDHHDQV
ncbi:ABC transporter ATP-binding protein [Devosia sp. YIM 151766]|uniref:ABC transporter ATP-binding protein n=1 Tax=Devosia sp. YIM 151766 TaxID=3017325 RepID=UPI00255CDB05|nr:ABC transporter ATP-binding protein [Devosia sp. YIM 151766]WIY53868.1 ABC transporter ATP-binding protein [Devosia sp. YIM 151766]